MCVTAVQVTEHKLEVEQTANAKLRSELEKSKVIEQCKNISRDHAGLWTLSIQFLLEQDIEMTRHEELEEQNSELRNELERAKVLPERSQEASS